MIIPKKSTDDADMAIIARLLRFKLNETFFFFGLIRVELNMGLILEDVGVPRFFLFMIKELYLIWNF